MPRIQNWRSLLPGVIAIAAIILGVMAVMSFARVGALHGSTIRVYSSMAEARGVMKGTPVWLEGQPVGQVVRVEFLPPSSDSNANVLVVMDLLKRNAKYIRRDALAQITSGGTLIGAPVVYLGTTASNAPLIAEGDTLHSVPQGDPEGVASRIALASRDFPAIIANVKDLRSQLSSAHGTTGALLNDDELRIDLAMSRGTQLADRALHGRGTIGQVLNGGTTRATARAQHALAEADSLRALVTSNQSVVGRFRRDTSLMRTVTSLRNDISLAKALLDEPRGTAGRVVHDSAMTRQLTAAEKEVAALIADLRAHPMRYVAF
ncbi:MAG TPA: MlaD family protein [Gemmatimonadaceae bacterium]|nr:MlaD family protein [Gemmatimonadaceae bacterium]